MNSEIEILNRKLERERAARIEAEKLLEEKSLEINHLKLKQQEILSEISLNRIIINSIPDLILQIDEKGVIKSFKPANQNNPFLFLNAEKNNTIDSVFIKPAAKSFSNAIKKCLATGSHQFDFQHLDGEKLQHFEARLIRLNPKEALVMIRDVTILREYEKQLLVAKTKAEVASISKSEFLANVSHEIRTPLNAILGLSQWLAENTAIKQHLDYLNTILINGKNLLNLLNDILDLSKIESGKMDIEMQPMSYRELISDIKMAFQPKAEQKGISFQINTDQSVPEYIYMDELRFYQIIFNLVSNAIKFTAKGFINISAYGIKTEEDKCIKLVIVVEDSGIGIEQEQQEKIFESFTQQSGQSNRKYGGTGLGLAIVRGLLDKLNGSVSLKSIPGKGSSFTITFNRVNIDYFNRESNYEEKEEQLKVLEPCKIMIVDDVNFNILVLKKLINPANVTFIEANDGSEALAKLENEIPDIIFMDIRMPGMNGFEVTEYIRSKPELTHIPVIAFTASVIRETNDRIDKLFDGYLQKPVFKKDIDNLLFKFLKFSYQTQITQNKISEITDEGIKVMNEKVMPELIVEIETKYQHKWENIKDNLVIYEIEEFKNQLADLAFQYSCKFITQYCNELDIGLQSFDIELIERKLNDFPKLVEQLGLLVKR